MCGAGLDRSQGQIDFLLEFPSWRKNARMGSFPEPGLPDEERAPREQVRLVRAIGYSTQRADAYDGG